MEETLVTLDLSNKKLKKINKPTATESQVTKLILDDNELTRLDNIDSFTKLQKFTAVRNQLLRMYGVCRLHLLHTLDLSYNGILTIEGLKELLNLKWLCLAGNSIKTIEHLHTNTNLEHLDLSENSITYITDLSFLRNLKELYLHKNKINHLGQCDRFLPTSLTTLTLAYNNIGDLNEISRLVNLVNLTKFSIANNPCVNMTGSNIGFDYRPFIVNWCLNVNVIDDYVVDAIESLRAEWLYSQGRGRHFRVGDQRELVQYLASVCPLTGEALETEEGKKLRLILSKAQHHQQQLREQSSNNGTPIPSPMSKKKLTGSRHSPRLIAKIRTKSPDRMVSSCYGTLSDQNNTLMTQSLDPTILRQSITPRMSNEYIIPEKCLDFEPVNSPLQSLSKHVPVPESLMSPDYLPSNTIEKHVQNITAAPISSPRLHNPKIAQSVRSPKPNRVNSATVRARSNLASDHLRKTGSPSPARNKKIYSNGSSATRSEPDKKTSILMQRSLSSDEESEICDAKLRTIQMKAEERRLQKEEVNSNCKYCNNDGQVVQAAVCIQRIWRGYYTRNKNKEVQEMFKELQSQRANQYIQKLATDMETTKAALESERKIQMLQTEAISALWKKISSIQPMDGEASSSTNLNMTNLSLNNAEVVKELAQTCTMLQTQIQQLQNSMQDVVKVMTIFSQTAGINHQLKDGIATQTEIVAVHTPQMSDKGKGRKRLSGHQYKKERDEKQEN